MTDYCPYCKAWHEGNPRSYAPTGRDRWWKDHSDMRHWGALPAEPMVGTTRLEAVREREKEKARMTYETYEAMVVRDPGPSIWSMLPEADAPYAELSAEQALGIILQEVRKSKDPFLETGAWITKVTNALTKQLKELEQK